MNIYENRDIALEKYKTLVMEARRIYPDPKYKDLLEESRDIFWEYKIKTKERKDVIPLFHEIYRLQQEAHKNKRAMEKELAEQRKLLKKGWLNVNRLC